MRTEQKKIYIFLLVVFTVPVLAYYGFDLYDRRMRDLPVLGPTGHTIPNFRFTNQEGKLIESEALWGNVIVANFFFTACPTICPQMSNSLKRVQDTYQDRKNLLILSYTVDPRRDDVEHLADYADYYGAKSNQWLFFTGKRQDIYRLARKGYLVTAQGDEASNDFIHSEKLILIDAQKQIRGYYDGTDEKEVDQLIYDIERMLEN